MKQTIVVLHGAAGFVLLIVCSNIASLLLAHEGVRQKEISIRTALGAGRWQIIRQLLTESVILSLLGGVMGLVLTTWGIEFLRTLLPFQLANYVTSRGIDSNILIFTFGVSILCGLIFGLVPALFWPLHIGVEIWWWVLL